MKKNLILIVLLVFVLCCSGCSGQGGAVANPQGVALQETPNIIYVTATPDTPYIIYVTATPEVKGAGSKADLSISNELLTGKVVYSKFLSHEPVDIQLFVMNLQDGVEKQITQDGMFSHPQWSPDGAKILYGSSSDETAFDILIMDEDGNNAYPIVATAGMDINAVWSPDGKMVAYNSDVDGNHEVYTINVATNEIKQITNDDAGYHGAPSWSPDGKKIVYVYGDGAQYGTHLFVYDIESGVSEEIDKEKLYLDDLPVWSPDGQSIIFPRLNGEFNKIVVYDLNKMEESLLTNNLFPDDNKEFHVEKSVHGNFVTFSENDKFYVMDMDAQLIYPLGINAVDLNYFPQ